MRKRGGNAAPVVDRAEVPEMLRGNGCGLMRHVPLADRVPPSGLEYMSPEFYRRCQARKLRDLARAEWCRLTGAVPPDRSWSHGYPFDVSASLRRAAEDLARQLAG